MLLDYAYRYALPEVLYDEHHIRRYGFHGTSHRYVIGEAARVLKVPVERLKGNTIINHKY